MDNYRELKIRCDPGFGHLLVIVRHKRILFQKRVQNYSWFMDNDKTLNTQASGLVLSLSYDLLFLSKIC